MESRENGNSLANPRQSVAQYNEQRLRNCWHQISLGMEVKVGPKIGGFIESLCKKQTPRSFCPFLAATCYEAQGCRTEIRAFK